MPSEYWCVDSIYHVYKKDNYLPRETKFLSSSSAYWRLFSLVIYHNGWTVTYTLFLTTFQLTFQRCFKTDPKKLLEQMITLPLLIRGMWTAQRLSRILEGVWNNGCPDVTVDCTQTLYYRPAAFLSHMLADYHTCGNVALDMDVRRLKWPTGFQSWWL